jgi:FAD/FMN-containing dehydrogenase
VSDAIIAESLKQVHDLWHIRESITLAQTEEGFNVKHDISVPISLIPEFVRETDTALATEFPSLRFVNFGHLGDGNLHYNIQAPEGCDAKEFVQSNEERIGTIVYDAVRKYRGSISAEHGVGDLKLDKLLHYKSSVAMNLMRAIKSAIDPLNTLSPGRVLKLMQ